MTKSSVAEPKTIAIYSVGLLGGSLGLALKKFGFPGKVIGLSSRANIDTALSLGCIDEGHPYDHLQEVIRKTDMLFLCSPITVIIETIQKLAKLELPDHLVITDVGSTKSEITRSAQSTLPRHVHFIGGHPMAGSEKHGPGASDQYLFQNAIYVITPVSGEPSGREEALAAFLKHYLGCRVVYMDPITHDTIAATVSHIPHILAVALVNLAQKMEEKLPGTMQLAAGGFRDMTRIASSPYAMWHDIFLTNRTAIEPLLDQCIDLLSTMKQQVRKGTLESHFEKAALTRRKIPLHNKGFLTPLSEILVIAKDQPGFIASLAGLLAKQNINIKDFEVLKMREGEGGTIRVAFDTEETARTAIEILTRNGFSARERK